MHYVPLALILALTVFFTCARCAFRPHFDRVALLGALAIVATEAAIAPLSVFLGRKLFAADVVRRLPQYEKIVKMADDLLFASGAQTKLYDPHADIAIAHAHLSEDGGLKVHLVFRHSRAVQLFFLKNHAPPPPERSGVCLEKLADHWYWFQQCTAQ